MITLCFLSADPFLGKIDKHLLSEQTIMELFIGDMHTKEKICGCNDRPVDLSDWTGLRFNDTKEIIEIDWSCKGLEGKIDLQWLPSSTEKVALWANNLSGTVDLTCLPDGLKWLSLSNNAFDGTVDLTRLPPGLGHLMLNDNCFSGQTDFSQLPKSLRFMSVSETQLQGELVEFTGLFMNLKSNVKDMRPKYTVFKK